MHIRNTATCTKCEPLNGQPGRMILDCAGSGDVKRRRFKCNRCKATLSVSQYLAVYSGHADLLGGTAPEAARRMDTLGEMPLSSEQPSFGSHRARSAFRLESCIPRRYTSGLANIVINTDHQQQAHQVQQQAAHQDASQVRLLAEPSSATSPEMGALPAYSGYSRTEQGGAADTCTHFTTEERNTYIEQTLDRLGLVGIGRKRRRTALEVLLPMGTPSKAKLSRVAIACGNVNAAAAREAIRALKIDPRLIHHVIKTDVGIELIIMDSDAQAIKSKATQQGVIMGEPKARQPKTRKECDMLLKALTPAANTAQHQATREYIREWIDEIKANLPAHTRPTRPHMGAQASEATGTEASVTGSRSTGRQPHPGTDPLDTIILDCFNEDLPDLGNHAEKGEPINLDNAGNMAQTADMIDATDMVEAADRAEASDLGDAAGMATAAAIWLNVEAVDNG